MNICHQNPNRSTGTAWIPVCILAILFLIIIFTGFLFARQTIITTENYKEEATQAQQEINENRIEDFKSQNSLE